MALSY
ncbi:hypothetical protein ZWY2020_013415 [Hordeum vulgare]